MQSETQSIINNMVFLLGLNSELQLGDFFAVSPTTISQWKKRDRVPHKYKKIVDDVVARRIEAAESIKGVNVSVQEVMDALGMKKDSTWIYQYKKKNPRLYALIEDGIRIEKLRTVKVSMDMSKQ